MYIFFVYFWLRCGSKSLLHITMMLKPMNTAYIPAFINIYWNIEIIILCTFSYSIKQKPVEICIPVLYTDFALFLRDINSNKIQLSIFINDGDMDFFIKKKKVDTVEHPKCATLFWNYFAK